METVREHASAGVAPMCRALNVPRASAYRRWAQENKPKAPLARPAPARALACAERERVLDTLHSERFVDQPPHQVYAALLDEGVYLCSVRTMYRILDTQGEVRERNPNCVPKIH